MIPDAKLIIVRPQISQTVRRCSIAHEVQHHRAGDRRIPTLHGTLKQEDRANRAAARCLIDPYALFQLQQQTEDPGVWAYELQVTGDILMAYLTA